MIRSVALMTLALGIGLGCNPHPLKEVEYESYVVDEIVLNINPQRDVDILFVIDNSGSMGEEQATLAANFEAFVGVLEDPMVAANYRIAVTTTDNGHPRCAGTGPEGGGFVLSSCWDRLTQFESQPGTSDPVDARAVACTDLCPEALADLQVLPSALEFGGEEVARPWFERIDGHTNLPDGVEAATAFACFGPQGVDGCGFESPLESMYKALTRTSGVDEDEFGFLREDALLAVVFVTDEADCSLRSGHDTVFDPEGDRALWSDLGVGYPTSGVCWNAGVTCSPAEDGTLACVSANVGADGGPAQDDDAVLLPLRRYTDLLQELQERKRERTGNPDLDVLVSVIAGVPQGGGDVTYTRGVDAAFEQQYGIAPGCSSSAGEAVPPVRLLELAGEFAGETDNVYSVCDDDYTPALEEIAERFRREFVPACAAVCPRDVDPVQTGHQSDCVFTETTPDGQAYRVPECEHDGMGWTLPDGDDVCVHLTVGDDRDARCIDAGDPVEFRPLYRPDVPQRSGGSLSARCSISANAPVDCPWL